MPECGNVIGGCFADEVLTAIRINWFISGSFQHRGDKDHLFFVSMSSMRYSRGLHYGSFIGRFIRVDIHGPAFCSYTIHELSSTPTEKRIHFLHEWNTEKRKYEIEKQTSKLPS